MYQKILVAYDGSEGSTLALTKAVKLAQLTGATLEAIWVKSKLPHYPETVSEIEGEREAGEVFFNQLQNEMETYSRQLNCNIKLVALAGHTAKTILNHALEGYFDLIVLGHQGHSSLWGVSLGHTTDKVSENAHCSVLIVR
ncbi:UspA domain-containing protein [Thioploca ingrica]|uniref:Universal stress protein n=1 Tax=Thioploca ingrica TaxID=40754 RepID=A0A090AHV5_9GAMM|nr:UspA domain-containing protein [Thioploca ingrica]